MAEGVNSCNRFTNRLYDELAVACYYKSAKLENSPVTLQAVINIGGVKLARLNKVLEKCTRYLGMSETKAVGDDLSAVIKTYRLPYNLEQRLIRCCKTTQDHPARKKNPTPATLVAASVYTILQKEMDGPKLSIKEAALRANVSETTIALHLKWMGEVTLY